MVRRVAKTDANQVMHAIIGVDPGSTETGMVIIRDDTLEVLHHQISPNTIVPFEEFICRAPGARVVLEQFSSYGMIAGRSVFETVFWSGRLYEIARQWKRQVKLLPRTEVKLALCHSRKAKDANIRQRIIDIYGGSKLAAVGLKAAPGPLYGIKRDQWAALAVALAWVQVNEPQRELHYEVATTAEQIIDEVLR